MTTISGLLLHAGIFGAAFAVVLAAHTLVNLGVHLSRSVSQRLAIQPFPMRSLLRDVTARQPSSWRPGDWQRSERGLLKAVAGTVLFAVIIVLVLPRND